MANLWEGLFGKGKKVKMSDVQSEDIFAVEYQLESLLKDVLSIGRYLMRNQDAEISIELGKDVPSVLCGDVESLRKRFEGMLRKAIEMNRGDLVRIFVAFKATEWKKGEVSFVINLRNPLEEFSFTVSQTVVDYKPLSELDELSDKEEIAKFNVTDTKVLVVDDNTTLLKMAKQMLSQFGCDVTCASGGEEALEKLRGDFFQIVFLDLMMPEMDGFEVASRIRAMGGEFRRIPIIALTGNAVVGCQSRCFEVGMDDYLSKPMHMEQLGQVLRKYIKEDRIFAEKQKVVPELVMGYTPEQERFLQRLVGFEVKQGLYHCMEDISIFISVVRSYYEDSLEARIEETYLSRDFENYTIYVHALKSTSKSIGAMRLAEMAYQLELAGKRADEDFIRENHVVCMDVYREHLEIVKVALSELGNEMHSKMQDEKKVQMNVQAVDAFFGELKAALDDMNPQKIETAVESLAMVSFKNPESNDVFVKIKGQVANFDFMEARESLEELIALEKDK